LTVSQTGVWAGVVDVVVVVAGIVDVAVVTTEVGESDAPVVEVGAVDWEHAVRETAKVTATSIGVLTRSVYLVATRHPLEGERYGRYGMRGSAPVKYTRSHDRNLAAP
jgi:hypothetical protein